LFQKNAVEMCQQMIGQAKKYLGSSVIGFELGNEVRHTVGLNQHCSRGGRGRDSAAAAAAAEGHAAWYCCCSSDMTMMHRWERGSSSNMLANFGLYPIPIHSCTGFEGVPCCFHSYNTTHALMLSQSTASNGFSYTTLDVSVVLLAAAARVLA
jgi:hypothetical protein